MTIKARIKCLTCGATQTILMKGEYYAHIWRSLDEYTNEPILNSKGEPERELSYVCRKEKVDRRHKLLGKA